MNKDTQNIYEAYVTESPDQIAKIDKRIARLQSKKAQLQQSGTPTTSSSTSTTTTGTASSTTNSADTGTNDWSQHKPEQPAAVTPDGKPVSQDKYDQYFNNPDVPDYSDKITTLDPIEIQAAPEPEASAPVKSAPVKRDRNSPERIAALQQRQAENPGVGPERTFGNGAPSDEESAAASAAIDSGEISSKPPGTEFDPWRQEQMRINNQTAEMPDNWRNASWAKRARTMGRGRNPAQVKALAQKEWDRQEAMRKEREMATSELNPNKQTGAQYFGNQLKKMPGNISAGLQGLGSAVFGKNKIPQTTAAGDAVRDADGKLQWRDNSTGKPGLVQRAGGAVKRAFTPSKPVAPASVAPAQTVPAQTVPAPTAPVQKGRFGRPAVNRRRPRVLNQSTNAFDAVLQDKNVDHLID